MRNKYSRNVMQKIVYLDQNKWIDLSRAFYGRDDGKPFINALECLRVLSQKSEIILPISIIHFMETSKIANRARRERLARFMVDLSRGYGILPFTEIYESEVAQAVIKKLGFNPHVNIKDLVIGKGVEYIMGRKLTISGVPPNVERELRTLALENVTLGKLLIEAYDKEVVKEMRNDNIDILYQLEESRRQLHKNLSKEKRLRLTIAQIAFDDLLPMVIKHLKIIGLDVKRFVHQIKTDVIGKISFLIFLRWIYG